MWRETVDALRIVIDNRPAPTVDRVASLVFITKYGQQWSKETTSSPISAEFRKLMQRVGLHRPGVGFRALRYTFETIGGDTSDQVAVDFIMGHAPRDDDMGAIYRQKVFDARLLTITDHVRDWLFG